MNVQGEEGGKTWLVANRGARAWVEIPALHPNDIPPSSGATPRAVLVRRALPMRSLSALVRHAGAAGAWLAVRLVELAFTTPVRYATRPGEREVLVGASREWLDFRGRRIAMWRWGAGPLVLLAHGWSGRGAQLAAFVEPLVEAGFSVLAWDAPGHGRSEGLRTDLPEFAALVEAVARRERDVHAIIGHSLGALAAALACARGARVRRVVFVSGPAEPASFFRMCLQAAGLSAPSQAAAMSEMERVHAFRWDDTNLVRRSAALAGVPSLVIHDLADLDVPYREGARVAAAWPGSRLLATRGLGHRRILRDAVVVDAAVRFVSEGAGVAYRTEAERLESDLFDRRGRWAALGESTAAVA